MITWKSDKQQTRHDVYITEIRLRDVTQTRRNNIEKLLKKLTKETVREKI